MTSNSGTHLSGRARAVPLSSTVQMADIAAELRRHGTSVVDFSAGRAAEHTPDFIVAAAIDALRAGDTHQTPAAGTPAYRAACAAKLARDNGIAADPETEIVATLGCKQGLTLALLALTDPGDEVIVEDPSFVSYAPTIALTGGRAVPVPLRAENRFRWDVGELRAAITPRTRAILMCSPHNPTGVVHTRAELEPIAALAREHDLAVISDEIYERVTWGGRRHVGIATLPDMAARTVTLMGMTKTYSMGGWRIGFAYAPPAIAAAMTKLQQHLMTCAGSFTQAGAAVALREGATPEVADLWRDWERRCEFLTGALNAIPGIACAMPEGGFYAWADIRALGVPSAALTDRLLREHAVAAVPGSSFGEAGEGYLRLTCVRSWDELRLGLDRLKTAFSAEGAPMNRGGSMTGAEKPRRSLFTGLGRSPGMLILLAMIAGVVFGLIAPGPARALDPVGQVFVRLLIAAAIPLVMANLLAGITGMSDVGLIGRIGGRFCIFFLLSTSTAIALGIGFTELYGPGRNVAALSATAQSAMVDGKIPSLGDFLYNLVPDNIVAAFAEGRVPQIIVFTLLLGSAVLLAPAEARRSFHRGAEVLDAVLRRLVSVIMLAAPIGIGALAASAAGQFGVQMLRPLLLFMGAVWSAQISISLLMLLAMAVLARCSPIRFVKATLPLYATAAATCSSLASLAVAVRMAEERLRLPRVVYSLTLPLGSQLSKEGTAAMLGAALIFTAQAAGVHFSLPDYATILIVGLFLAGASGGIPGGGLVQVLLMVEAFHLPLEIAAVIGGIYRLLDVGNTTVNVLGDMIGTQIVAAAEANGE